MSFHLYLMGYPCRSWRLSGKQHIMFFFFLNPCFFNYRLEQIYTHERIFVSPYTYLHIFFIIIFHNCATYISTHICFYTDQVMLHNLYSSYIHTVTHSIYQDPNSSHDSIDPRYSYKNSIFYIKYFHWLS
jgi:hypothetical protein